MKSLRSRVTLVVVAVAVLAVLVTSLVSFQLVRLTVNQEARAQISSQADAIASLLDLVDNDLVDNDLVDNELIWAALGETRYAIVSRTDDDDGDGDGGLGSVDITGSAAELVDTRLLLRLAAGESVSTVRLGKPSGSFLIEARVSANGTGIVLALPQERIDRLVRESAGRIALALGLGVLVALIAGALLARWISTPIKRVGGAARRLAAGERGVELDVRKPAEVAAIAEALSALDTALSTSEGRQREFLLSISHELRTPLTAVRGYAEALSDGMIPADEVAAVGATLVAETERIDRFVADLLELARLESDDFSIHPQPVALAEVLEATAAAWAAHAQRLGVALTVAGDVQLSTDPQRVRQLIDGLVENALRATPEGGQVVVTAAADAQDVLIEVADGGPGLSSDDQAVAFERGVLRSRYRDIRPVGTGLGLSIAARLAARLGGTITASSAPSGGALFTVRLPAQPTAGGVSTDSTTGR